MDQLEGNINKIVYIYDNMASYYDEDNIEEFGIVNKWKPAEVKQSILTSRGTKVEIVERPKWGLACYMDNSIQSCEVDERIYHESLVHPIMSSCEAKRVMIIGGGEGATAREVLKWNKVLTVDMYEWDMEVVELFRNKYPQWAKGAWNDSRLTIHNVDIFDAILMPPTEEQLYDIIIIDLFDPTSDNMTKWKTLIQSALNWLNKNGSIVMYAGMRNILEKEEQSYTVLMNLIKSEDTNQEYDVIPYRVYIPSFSGESMFLLLTSKNNTNELDINTLKEYNSHITKDIWNSYKTLNW